MRIALVESNKQLIKTILRYLDTWSTLSQYEKPTFLQFADELQFLSGYYGSIDLIVADVQLPHMDGIEFMRRLRVYDRDTPVILLSDNGEAARLGYRYNVFDYLLKPVDANDCSTACSARLRTCAHAPLPAIPSSAKASCGGRPSKTSCTSRCSGTFCSTTSPKRTAANRCIR